METRNCKKCGRLYSHVSSYICDDCRKEEEKKFEELKDYLDKNPRNNINEVSNATGVSTKKILSYIKDGRLIVSEGLTGLCNCGRCGVKINSGKFCDKCVIEINNQVTDMFSERKPTIKMHTSNSK